MTRVLVVEDEESFSRRRCPTCCAGRASRSRSPGPARTALDEFDRSGADLVLLDLMLPGLSGTEVCRALRAALQRADHHAHRQRQRGRQGRRARARRRRLRHQAVLARASWSPASGPCCAAAASREELVRPTRRGRPGADGRRPARRHRRRRAGGAAAEGVRPARAAAAQRRPGAHPRPAHRPGLGRGLRRRHQDPRRPRQAAARQDRAGPGERRSTWSPSAAWATSSTPELPDRGALVPPVGPQLRIAVRGSAAASRGARRPGRAPAGGAHSRASSS